MGLNLISAISKIVGISKTIKNPKEAVNMALSALQKKNPQAAQLISDAIKSGKSPSQFAKEQAQNGNLTSKNLNDLKSYYGIAKSMGLPSIPDKDWKEIEQAIETKQTNNFNGF